MELSASAGCSHQTDLICTAQRGEEDMVGTFAIHCIALGRFNS